MTAESLLEESNEAQVFLAQCRSNLQDFVLYPDEDFEDLQEVSLGAVGVDLQGEPVALKQPQRIVERVQEASFWITLYHDPRIHPVARVLTAQLFTTPSGVVFVAGLVGTYDRANLPSLSDKLDVSVAPRLEQPIAGSARLARLSFNPFELPVSLTGRFRG